MDEPITRAFTDFSLIARILQSNLIINLLSLIFVIFIAEITEITFIIRSQYTAYSVQVEIKSYSLKLKN